MKYEKEITIYDIAEKLKISAATVSRALSGKLTVNADTRKLISDTAKEMGYRSNNFASNLRKSKTHTIGVLLHELNSTFMVSVLSGIESIIAEKWLRYFNSPLCRVRSKRSEECTQSFS